MLSSIAALTNLLCGEVSGSSFHCSFTSGWQASTCPIVKVYFSSWGRHDPELREASLLGSYFPHREIEQCNLVR